MAGEDEGRARDPRPRPRHDQRASDRLRRRRRRPFARATRARSQLPAAGLGGAGRARDLDGAARDGRRSIAQQRRRHRRRGRHRYHRPARDHHRVGQSHVAAHRAGDRVAGPAHREALRRAARRWSRGAGAPQDGPRARSLLLGDQDPLAPRHRARRPREGRARRARLRHRRQLAGVAAHRRPSARDRRHQRLADAPLRPPHRRLGRRAARALRRAAGAAARRCATPAAWWGRPRPRSSGRLCPWRPWSATSRPPSSARRARRAA